MAYPDGETIKNSTDIIIIKVRIEVISRGRDGGGPGTPVVRNLGTTIMC